MALLTADVTKLRCLYLKLAYLKMKALQLATDCEETLSRHLILVDAYFNVWSKTPTLSASCECAIREVLDTYEIDTKCTTKEVDENLGITT